MRSQIAISRGVCLFILLHTVCAATNITTKISKNCTCGTFDNDQGLSSWLRVVNGKETMTKAHPWLALLLRKGSFFCGGSIINSWYVLTAAHCVHGGAKKDYKVTLGAHYRKILKSGHEQQYTVEAVLVHEAFKKVGTNGGLDNDIALLKLHQEIPFNDYVKPICLPTTNTSGYETANVQGWGNTEYKGYSSLSALQATLSVMTTERCQDSYASSYLGDPATHLCAQDLFADSCAGDSGGPLFVATENQTGIQIGIVSVGAFCAKLGYPAVYTKVDAFLDWILEHTSDAVYCSSD